MPTSLQEWRVRIGRFVQHRQVCPDQNESLTEIREKLQKILAERRQETTAVSESEEETESDKSSSHSKSNDANNIVNINENGDKTKVDNEPLHASSANTTGSKLGGQTTQQTFSQDSQAESSDLEDTSKTPSTEGLLEGSQRDGPTNNSYHTSTKVQLDSNNFFRVMLILQWRMSQHRKGKSNVEILTDVILQSSMCNISSS